MTDYEIRSFGLSERPSSPTEVLCVDDLYTRKHHVIIVQPVDFRPNRAPIESGLARFTSRQDCPSETGDIQLCTPGFYRKLEDGDELDGAQEVDMAPFVASQLRKTGFQLTENDFTANAAIASPKEPWILCTSIKPSDATGARSLERQFSYKGPNARVNIIEDRNAFARQLGIDIARSVETKHSVRQGALQKIFRDQCQLAFGDDREIDAVVRVIHGPVHYDNVTSTVREASDFAKADAYRIWFTKGTGFSDEREYRFAVFAGPPRIGTIRLDVSTELSRLVRSWQLGEGWWSS